MRSKADETLVIVETLICPLQISQIILLLQSFRICNLIQIELCYRKRTNKHNITLIYCKLASENITQNNHINSSSNARNIISITFYPSQSGSYNVLSEFDLTLTNHYCKMKACIEQSD